MANAEQADIALKGVEAQLSNGRATDVMAIMADFRRIQQDLDERLDKVDLN